MNTSIINKEPIYATVYSINQEDSLNFKNRDNQYIPQKAIRNMFADTKDDNNIIIDVTNKYIKDYDIVTNNGIQKDKTHMDFIVDSTTYLTVKSILLKALTNLKEARNITVRLYLNSADNLIFEI